MRTSKVVGFSIPPELLKKFEEVINKTHKTKSEFFRELLNLYFNTSRAFSRERDLSLDERDIAGALRLYWDIKSSTDITTLVVGLAVIVKNGKVLIGSRKEKDPHVENLTWVFPGGAMKSLDFAKEIKSEVKKETGLNIEVKSLISARVHPDSGFKPVQIVALYFYCQPADDKKERRGDAFSRIKWVRPMDIYKHFTTSTSEDVNKFLMTIEKSSKGK